MKKIWKIILSCIAAIAIMALVYLAWYWNLIPKRSYTAADFGIDTVRSTVDFNENGADDYTDLLRGAL